MCSGERITDAEDSFILPKNHVRWCDISTPRINVLTVALDRNRS